MLLAATSAICAFLFLLVCDFSLWRHAQIRRVRSRLRTLELDGTQILYADIGEGEPILYIFGGGSGPDSAPQFAWLAGAGYRVLSINRPGYLGAPLPADTSFREQADLYASVLDRLGVAEVHVFGLSMGGATAVHFAERHAERAHTLVLWSAVTGRYAPNPETSDTLLARIILAPGFRDILSWLMSRTTCAAPAFAMQELLRTEAKLGPYEREALVRQELELPGRRDEFLVFSDSLHPFSLRHPGMSKELELAAQPWSCPLEKSKAAVLSAHSPLDLDCPPSHQQELRRLRPKGRYLQPRSGGHFCWWGDEGQALRAETLAFLRRHPIAPLSR